MVVQVSTPSRTTLSVVGGSRPPSNRPSWRSARRLGWAGLGTPGWAGARCRASLHAVARGHHGAISCSLQRRQRRRRDAGREGGGGASPPALSSTRGRGRGGVQRSLRDMSQRALCRRTANGSLSFKSFGRAQASKSKRAVQAKPTAPGSPRAEQPLRARSRASRRAASRGGK